MDGSEIGTGGIARTIALGQHALAHREGYQAELVARREPCTRQGAAILGLLCASCGSSFRSRGC